MKTKAASVAVAPKDEEEDNTSDEPDSGEEESSEEVEQSGSGEEESSEEAEESGSEEESSEESSTPAATPEDHPGDLKKFALSEAMVEKLTARGVKHLFPVQYLTYNEIIAGLDVVAQAHTGTGKTFAFALPLVQMLESSKKHSKVKSGRKPVVLVLAPTRELVKQIAADFQAIISTHLKALAVYGGVAYEKHTAPLKKGEVDIIVGAPGRVKDLMHQGHLSLKRVRYVVLDEVDRMLDMGFREDVELILRSIYAPEEADDETNKRPQTLMFSATMPPWVSEIARTFLKADSKGNAMIHRVSLTGNTENGNKDTGNKTSSTVEHLALQCPWQERPTAISDVISAYCVGPESRCIVFCERKKDADELASHAAMSSECHVLHGDIPQEKRELVLEKFRSGKYRILVTTNVAARGLDIPSVELVIQCRPPKDHDDYIHRSGRTGRAGRAGQSVCFYTAKEREELQALEKAVGIHFRRIACPTTQDIVKSSVGDTIKGLTAIPEATWQVFLEAARTAIEELGAERAVACSLAKMSGKITALKTRSVLTTREGFTAYHMATEMESIRGKGFAYNVLRKYLPEEVTETISHLMFTKNRTGFVFDLPSEHDEAVKKQWEDGGGVTLEAFTEIPELAEDEQYAGTGGGAFMNNGGNSNGRFQRGRGRGFGDRGGGRGRGGQFRGSFQRPWQNRNDSGEQQNGEGDGSADNENDGDSGFRSRGRGGFRGGGGRGFRGQSNGFFPRGGQRGDFRGKRPFSNDSSFASAPDSKKARDISTADDE